jgi:uncharacterized protein CbrC (UPF0167 family)
MVTVGSTEISALTCQTARRHNPDNYNENRYCRENLKNILDS